MIPEDEMQKLAERLLVKTKRDEIEWQRVELPRDHGASGMYDFQEGETHVGILSFPAQRGTASSRVLQVHVSEVLAGRLSGRENYAADELLEALYQEAERTAVRWDKALDQLNKLLETETVLGRTN